MSDLLLDHGSTPHGNSLEDYVTTRPVGTDTLGARHFAKRDSLTLEWLTVVARAPAPVRILDVGCSYGNHLLMLNAALGKPPAVELVGIDLDTIAIRRANDFAGRVAGYANCRFLVADIAAGLPFDDQTFAAVNLADVLEHLRDPAAALDELARITRPGGTLVISTPILDSLFKRASRTANRASRGRLYRAYYEGKGATLDAAGEPVMEVQAGEDHVSEMPLAALEQLCRSSRFEIVEIEPMSVMSGSRWFDQHLVLLSGLLLLEAVHERLRRPHWGHSVMIRLGRKP